MTKLDRLITELCPDGVEYAPVKLIADVGTGSSDRINAVENGAYPFYVRSQTVIRSNRYLFDEEAIVIPGEGGIGDIFHFVQGKYDLHQRAYRIRFAKGIVDTKYAYYYFAANFKKFILMKAVSATVTSIRKPMIEDFMLPVPPLPIQSEIVRILDNFTELTAELTAELTERKKQYNYYRDELLTFGEDVPMVALGEVCKIGDGLHGTPEHEEDGNYYFINGNNLKDGRVICENNTKKVGSAVYKKHGIAFSVENTVFMSINGTIGNVSLYNNENVVLGKSVAYFNNKANSLNTKYLFFLLQTDYSHTYYERQKTGSTIKNLGLKALREYKIPVPPIEEQARIIDILDRFDALTTDISIGLPAEIAARQKQYEYYRDKLLTFNVANV